MNVGTPYWSGMGHVSWKGLKISNEYEQLVRNVLKSCGKWERSITRPCGEYGKEKKEYNTCNLHVTERSTVQIQYDTCILVFLKLLLMCFHPSYT